ncbi:MAG: ribosome maturation factor RimP, partial [Clostridia bacterium]|nr:ribosome maturation factor RimP [Clostridia bacterium]
DGMHLVIYIGKLGGITIEDCVETNALIDPVLDDLNPTNDEHYVLDVSSYGLDKPLKFDWQFKEYNQKLVDVKLYRTIDGRKEFVATLLGRTDNTTQFGINNTNFEVNNSDIAYVLPHIEF